MKNFLNALLSLGLGVAATSCDNRAHADRMLCAALQTGDTDYLQKYLSLGGEIDRPVRLAGDRIESAPLIDVAVEYGQTNAIGFLLRRGANPNRKDSGGDTP